MKFQKGDLVDVIGQKETYPYLVIDVETVEDKVFLDLQAYSSYTESYADGYVYRHNFANQFTLRYPKGKTHKLTSIFK